jgi:hypothetical protein
MQRLPSSEHDERRGHWRRVLAFAALVLLAGALVWPVSSSGQQAATPAAVVVGRLYGDDISVQGAVSFESNYGMNTALLASGSDVTVRSGRAQIELMRGGAVAICGPAHFTLLESGGAITLALDYGRVRPQVDAQVNLTVFTPMIVATPVAIGTNPRDLTVGLDREGAMCTLTSRGAARIAQQLSGESVLVPQGGEITLNGGQLGTLRSAEGSCDCELLVTRNMAPAPKSIELSIPVPNPATRPRPAAQPVAPPPAPPAEQPIYRVYLPPLTFDASAPDEPPDPDPAHILMVRQAMPLPDLNLGAPTEPSATRASDYVPPAPPAVVPVKAAAPATQPKKGNIFARFFGAMFRRKGAHCQGTGCGDSGN